MRDGTAFWPTDLCSRSSIRWLSGDLGAAGRQRRDAERLSHHRYHSRGGEEGLCETIRRVREPDRGTDDAAERRRLRHHAGDAEPRVARGRVQRLRGLGHGAFYSPVKDDKNDGSLLFERGAYTVVIDPTRIGGTSADYPTEKQYLTLARAIYKHLG